MAEQEDKWLARMTRAFMELDSSTHAINTKQFAEAMQQVGGRAGRCRRACGGWPACPGWAPPALPGL